MGEHFLHCWECCGSYGCLHRFFFIMHSMSLRFFPNYSQQAFPPSAGMDLSGETCSYFCLWGSWRELLLRGFLWQTTRPHGSTELVISLKVILRFFSVVCCCFLMLWQGDLTESELLFPIYIQMEFYLNRIIQGYCSFVDVALISPLLTMLQWLTMNFQSWHTHRLNCHSWM